MGNMPFGETLVLRHAAERLREFMPASWDVNLVPDVRDNLTGRRYDADLILRSPAGETIFVVEVKSSKQGSRSAKVVVDQLRDLARGRPALLVTSFANPPLRRACEDAGVGYLDETGWAYLRSDDTGLFVVHEGAKRAPSLEKRDATMSRLDGPGASAVIRCLWEISTPIGVRALASEAEVSPGTAAKVLPSLASYGAIERDSTGAVTAVDRRLLLERWVQDYGFFTTNSEVHWFLASRGPDYAYKQLENQSVHQVAETMVALTGYLAAFMALPRGTFPVIPHSLLSLYAWDPELLASALSLKPATRQTANVVIVKPRDASLLRPGLEPVPVPQALADLMTMGGRFPELAEQVFEILVDTHL